MRFQKSSILSVSCRLILALVLLALPVRAQSFPGLPNVTTAADSIVSFNEIMYHPGGDDPTLEWIELYNDMSIDIELSNWVLEGGVDYRFPTNLVLLANTYIVVAADPAALSKAAGITNVVGPFAKRLANSGDTLRLRDHNRRLIDEISYSDREPWPILADGTGLSLAKKDRFMAGSPAANWRASQEIGGTPGRANFSPAQTVQVVTDTLVGSSSPGRWLVPKDDSLASLWLAPEFDDGSWSASSNSLGYDAAAPAVTDLVNVARGRPVIDGTGAYSDNPFDVPDGAGNFVAQNVTDGSDSDQFGVNYWLGRQGHIDESFTLDLGKSYPIREIRLRNTHNTGYNDRGTATFRILASDTVDAAKQLVSPQIILDGKLSDTSGLAPIPPDVFTSANGLKTASARYLQFVALTANNAFKNVGLNEIEVYAPQAVEVARAYAFDGNLADASGHGFAGQDLGVRFSSDVPAQLGRGQSVEFNGVSGGVQIMDAVSPDAYTLSAWVSVDDVKPCGLIVRTDSAGPNRSWSHQLRVNAAGHFEHYLSDGVGRSVEAAERIQPGVWYHVAAGATNGGSMSISVNGVQTVSSFKIGSLVSGGDRWLLGSDAAGAFGFFHGRLDALAVWHRVLDPALVQRLAAGAPPTTLNGFNGLFTTDVQSSLYGRNSSLFARFPFTVGPGLTYDRLSLRVAYADGFAAFLNGTPILLRNAPQPLSWVSAATANRPDDEASQPEIVDLGPFAPLLRPGRNVLAVQALGSSAADPRFLFSAELTARQSPPSAALDVVLNEVAAGNSPDFFVEIANRGDGGVNLSGARLVSSLGPVFFLPARIIAAGELLSFSADQLGFTPSAGQKLFLFGPGSAVLDGVEVRSAPLARSSAPGRPGWFVPSAPTPGAPNQFSFHDEIVINEIMYNHLPHYSANKADYADDPEQWIELYNRSSSPVSLAGWRFTDEIDYVFPAGATLAPDSYLVVARDGAVLRAKYPDIAILGDFKGKLSHRAGTIVLRDADGNPVNSVSYFGDHPWPSYPDGGGSSLELRDPRMDNSVAEAWAASAEGGKTAWKRYTFRAKAITPKYTPAIFSFHEFRLGLLSEGEALLDNVTVTELPLASPPRQLLQNTNFTAGLAKWRKLGTHSHSFVEPRAEDPADSVLHLRSTGSMSYLDNRLETTLKVGTTLVPVVVGRDYEISFDAKWLAGSPQLHTELYYNKVTGTTILDTPDRGGTPGRRNSAHVPNAGPTFSGLRHTPVIPKAGQEITVSVAANDPDGVASLVLAYSVNGGVWRNIPMAQDDSVAFLYAGKIPAQVNGAVIQFYVSASDARGAVSTFPAGGPASRALIKVDSTRLVANKQTFRTIMTPADSSLLHATTNLMSDDLLGCTAVHNETEVFYDAHIRLHGSMFSRTQPDLTGMTVKFPADHLFRGTRDSVIARRRGLVETFVKHILNAVGGLPANRDDIVHFVSHRTDNLGTARLNLANYDNTYVDSQFENNNGGTVFKLEGIREYQATDNNNPEGYKLPMPIGWIINYDISNLGDDPEQYRWSILIQSQKSRDDYSGIVAMGKALSLSGAALHDAAAKAIDVDEWARLFALQNLTGIGDVYGVENPHNFCFYVRPDDGRVVGLQNDWEFAFGQATTASIYGAQNVYKMLRVPGFKRLYHGHLLDMINTVYTSAYLTPWAKHFSAITGEGYTGYPAYASSRASSVRSQLNQNAPKVPFEITSNGGADLQVATPTVTLEGRAWIDVRDIRLAGSSAPLPLVWLDDARWQIVLPLKAGPNAIRLEAVGYRGALVAQDSITVTTTVSEFPQRDYLRVSELMYHPPDPTPGELAAGFNNSDDFEFIELVNIGPVEVPLAGVKFTAGVSFDFTAGTIPSLPPGRRVVIVRNAAAFAFRYGNAVPFAGVYTGSLSNSGEVVRLVDSTGVVIQEFAYQDAGGWPLAADGLGSSLEVVDPKGNYGDPANWVASALRGGTPGLPPAVAPSIASVSYEGNRVRVKFQLAPGQACTVYRRDSLSAGSWEVLQSFPATDGGGSFEVADIPVGQTRFYRLSSP